MKQLSKGQMNQTFAPLKEECLESGELIRVHCELPPFVFRSHVRKSLCDFPGVVLSVSGFGGPLRPRAELYKALAALMGIT